MAKKRRTWGGVLLLVGLFALAGALILLLPSFLRARPILPMESPDTTAKRFAPENAFFALAEATALLPKSPGFANANSGRTEKYRPEPGSLGWLLDVLRPDDDTDFVAFLDAFEPAVVKTREALQHPYFLLPVHWSKYPSPDDADSPANTINGIYWLAPLLTARGVQAARAGDGTHALNGILESIRLLLLVRDEWEPWGRGFAGVVCVHEMVHAATDAALEATAVELQRLRAGLGPPAMGLTFLLRLVDCEAIPDALDEGGAQLLSQINEGHVSRLYYEITESVQRRRLRDWIIGHRDEIASVISMFPGEARCWSDDAVRKLGSICLRDKWILPGIGSLAGKTASLCLLLDGSAAVVALERYRRAEGGYPETLNALAPKYIGAVPIDPFAGAPLFYKRVDGDYQLYSVGRNGKDDGGGAIPEGMVVPRGDDLVIHWPRTTPS